MRPVGERVYTQAILPYMSGQATPVQSWAAGSAPIKTFMVDQVILTKHQDYLWAMYRYAVPYSPGQIDPQYDHEFPFRVVAPAYLLSELTTALVMGFYLYLPFLVIDLVVSGAGGDGSVHAAPDLGRDAHQADRFRAGRWMAAGGIDAPQELRGWWVLAPKGCPAWT